MKKSNCHNGSNTSVGLDVNEMINLRLSEPIHIDCDCLGCHLARVDLFKKNMSKFETLPLAERLIEMKLYRYQLDVRKSIDQEDYVGTLDKLIAFTKDKLENELKIQEDKQKSDAAASMIVQEGAPKLVLDADEAEIAAMMKHLLVARNKRKNLIFRGTHKELAEWMHLTIITKNNDALNTSTVCNYLSKPDNISLNE